MVNNKVGREGPKQPTEFQQKIFNAIASIPEGEVTTYGHIARAIGRPNMARYLTGMVSKHPHAHMLPWHRVVYSDGRVWSKGAAMEQERIQLFKHEGVHVENGKIVDFHDILYTFE